MTRLLVLTAAFLVLLGTTALAQSSEREPNNTKNLADGVAGYTIYGRISTSKDVDWFVLNGQEGTNPTMTIRHASGIDIDFEVFSGDSSVGTCSGTSPTDSRTFNVPGKCYVKVWGFRGTGSYTITINPSGGAVDNGGNDGGYDGGGYSGSDERESNNTKELADGINDLEINGAIGGSGDVDWFVLNGQEGSNPTFTIYHDSSIDVDFEVYSGDTSVGTCSGTQSGDSRTFQVPGRCFVRVWGFRGTGAYRIVINP